MLRNVDVDLNVVTRTSFDKYDSMFGRNGQSQPIFFG
jgi:hypothetical protein